MTETVKQEKRKKNPNLSRYFVSVSFFSPAKHFQCISNTGTYKYTVSQKNCAKCFCHNFVKFPPTLITFGTLIAQRISLCDVHIFFTSPNSRQRPTMLNADVPNCYITL